MLHKAIHPPRKHGGALAERSIDSSVYKAKEIQYNKYLDISPKLAMAYIELIIPRLVALNFIEIEKPEDLEVFHQKQRGKTKHDLDPYEFLWQQKKTKTVDCRNFIFIFMRSNPIILVSEVANIYTLNYSAPLSEFNKNRELIRHVLKGLAFHKVLRYVPIKETALGIKSNTKSQAGLFCTYEATDEEIEEKVTEYLGIAYGPLEDKKVSDLSKEEYEKHRENRKQIFTDLREDMTKPVSDNNIKTDIVERTGEKIRDKQVEVYSELLALTYLNQDKSFNQAEMQIATNKKILSQLTTQEATKNNTNLNALKNQLTAPQCSVCGDNAVVSCQYCLSLFCVNSEKEHIKCSEKTSYFKSNRTDKDIIQIPNAINKKCDYCSQIAQLNCHYCKAIFCNYPHSKQHQCSRKKEWLNSDQSAFTKPKDFTMINLNQLKAILPVMFPSQAVQSFLQIDKLSFNEFSQLLKNPLASPEVLKKQLKIQGIVNNPQLESPVEEEKLLTAPLIRHSQPLELPSFPQPVCSVCFDNIERNLSINGDLELKISGKFKIIDKYNYKNYMQWYYSLFPRYGSCKKHPTEEN